MDSWRHGSLLAGAFERDGREDGHGGDEDGKWRLGGGVSRAGDWVEELEGKDAGLGGDGDGGWEEEDEEDDEEEEEGAATV